MFKKGNLLKISYLDGSRLYNAFLAGGNAVIEDKDYLNKINVFPIPDADTGTNLASTMRSIAEEAKPYRSLKKTLHSIADAALLGARGNSGIIFAQFLYGFCHEMQNDNGDMKISTMTFGKNIRNAVSYAYKSLVTPVEGTMLTVIKDWAEAIYEKRKRTSDFAELLSDSLQAARTSLKETPKKLAVLAKAGVVDAGAKGFVDFLEGIVQFIMSGKLRKIPKFHTEDKDQEIQQNFHSFKERIQNRYCAEALMVNDKMPLDRLRSDISPFGDSVIVAGSDTKARVHIHTDAPADLFYKIKDYGDFVQLKIDDMQKQYEVAHKRRARIALVTDSACDLPQELIDKYQIHVVPFYVHFGNSLFLDKLSITPEQLYTMLRTRKDFPKSAQPNVKTIENLFSFLASHYESIIMVTVSSGLSGMNQTSQNLAKKMTGKNIQVIDSRNLSVTQGLLVLRMAEAIEQGRTLEDIVRLTEEWIPKLKILVDVQTMKYLVRGGRVKPMKGLVAKILNIKPILSISQEGKATNFGKSFSRRGNMKKILRNLRQMYEEGEFWKYAIVHAQNRPRAELYAQEIKEMIQEEPAFIIDVSPVLGVHTGIGTLGIAFMYK